jgi:hypothetical protein
MWEALVILLFLGFPKQISIIDKPLRWEITQLVVPDTVVVAAGSDATYDLLVP